MIPRLPDFIPAKPTGWLIKPAQIFARLKLAFGNRLIFSNDDLNKFERLPKSAGVILASNHADESDPLVCLELSRRIKRRFFSMCNREAFDEMLGLAGLVLQRIGHFSVKRGAHDSPAKAFAIKTVQRGDDVLMIFPEGEIFYLNEKIQPFHSGAVEICLQAILENRKKDKDWTAFILPMVIKYHYGKNIEKELEKRIAKMEKRLMLNAFTATLQERLFKIQSMLLAREERLYSVKMDLSNQLDLTQQIILTEKSILSEIAQKHANLPRSERAATIDQAWQLEAEIRADIAKSSDNRVQLQDDLKALQEVAQLSSWRPSYYIENDSLDRLSEAVLKQERELYRIKRPTPLASRYVIVKIGEAIDMGEHVASYVADPHATRASLTQEIHDQIQSLLVKAVEEAKAVQF